MSHKSFSKKFWDAQSLGAVAVSEEFTIDNLQTFGITIECKSVTANTGAFTVEISNGGKWMPHTVTAALAGAAKDYVINLANVGFKYLRVSFAPGGGSPDGNATAYICGKSI